MVSFGCTSFLKQNCMRGFRELVFHLLHSKSVAAIWSKVDRLSKSQNLRINGYGYACDCFEYACCKRNNKYEHLSRLVRADRPAEIARAVRICLPVRRRLYKWDRTPKRISDDIFLEKIKSKNFWVCTSMYKKIAVKTAIFFGLGWKLIFPIIRPYIFKWFA